MQGPFLVPLAILLQLDFVLELFLVSFGVVINVLAGGALEFDQVVLGHGG